MGYRHDIFISYRRDTEVLGWINDHFLPLLKTNVTFELGREPDVFVDQQLEVGGIWPFGLADSISRSRILISLWTKTYLFSEWCTLEMSHMLERDKKTGFRTPDNPYSLIIPVIIHDGETPPPEISLVQKIEITSFFTVRMHKYSESAEKLSQALYLKAGAIASAIRRAPEWEDNWKIDATNSFFKKYHDLNSPMQHEITKYTRS